MSKKLPTPLGAAQSDAVLLPSPSGGRPGWGPPPAKPSPLASLNTHIAHASQLARQQIAGTTASAPQTTPWPTLRSAQRFHETWSRISAETEVAKAEQRAPDNAGPLNSHKLVLHTLSLMRSLSPEYLRGFLAQAETLRWLEQAHALPRPQASGKGVAAKVVRKKK